MIIKTRLRDSANLWWLLPVSVLIIGLAARVVASTADTLSYDAYAMMNGVEKPFVEYQKNESYMLPIIIHYWVSYRLLGGNLYGYMVLPLAFNLAALVIVYLGLRRYLHASSGLATTCFALVLLAFNNQSLYLAGYPMVTYASGFLLAAILFFLFVHLSQSSLSRKTWIKLTLCFIPLGFFPNMIVIVPVVTGTASAFLVRFWQSTRPISLKFARQLLSEYIPLTVFPLAQLVLLVVHPFTNLGVEKRPDMAWLFFPTSSYPQNIVGAVKFLVNNSASLFASLLFPSNINGAPKPFWIALGVFIAVIIAWFLIRLLRHRLDSRITFTLLFIAITSLGIAIGGLLGLYPFGSARYADYLLLPAAIVFGYIASSMLNWVLTKLRITRSPKVLPVILSLLILSTGTYYNFLQYESNSSLNSQNALALEDMEQSGADVILLSSFNVPVIAARLPGLYKNSSNIGWGVRFGHGSDGGVPDDIAVKIIGSGSSKPGSILVIAPSAKLFATQYPSWAEFMNTNFTRVKDIVSPSIWGGYFVRN